MTSKSVLTKKQEQLANSILDSGSNRNLDAIPKVQALVAADRYMLGKAMQIKRADVIRGFQESIEMARLAADPASMIRGWTEIGKMLGLYAPEVKKVEMTLGSKNIRTKYENMSDEELLAIVEGRTIDGECETVETIQ